MKKLFIILILMTAQIFYGSESPYVISGIPLSSEFIKKLTGKCLEIKISSYRGLTYEEVRDKFKNLACDLAQAEVHLKISQDSEILNDRRVRNLFYQKLAAFCYTKFRHTAKENSTFPENIS